jgi:lysophospholipase L1-like esterase
MGKAKNAYAGLIWAVFHGALLFVLLNLLAQEGLELFPGDPLTITYGDRSYAAVYPGRTRAELRQLLLETWKRTPAFEPFTDSKERRHEGRFVNVDPAGFRLSRDQAPWRPDPGRVNVFVFGGSTTFGYGVADDETIVSALQADLAERAPELRVACYNFGSGGYYSTQERILFQELLAAGNAPRCAIFIDGLNDFVFPAPWPTPLLRHCVASPVPAALELLEAHLPLALLVARAKARRALRPVREDLSGYDDPPLLDARIDRYLANRRLAADAAADYGVRALFVWQPVPTYRYDLRWHLFGEFDFEQNNYARFGYARFRERMGISLGEDFLWLADMQEPLPEPLYVDQVHYTAAMSRRIAGEIGRTLLERGLLAPRPNSTVIPSAKGSSRRGG